MLNLKCFKLVLYSPKCNDESRESERVLTAKNDQCGTKATMTIEVVNNDPDSQNIFKIVYDKLKTTKISETTFNCLKMAQTPENMLNNL